MSVELDASRASRRRGRGRNDQPTIREICPVGMTRLAMSKAGTIGRGVIALGRCSQVVATSTSISSQNQRPGRPHSTMPSPAARSLCTMFILLLGTEAKRLKLATAAMPG